MKGSRALLGVLNDTELSESEVTLSLLLELLVHVYLLLFRWLFEKASCCPVF